MRKNARLHDDADPPDSSAPTTLPDVDALVRLIKPNEAPFFTPAFPAKHYM